jgi:hypothetical protein
MIGLRGERLVALGRVAARRTGSLMVVDFPEFVTDFLNGALEQIAPHFADYDGIPKDMDER